MGRATIREGEQSVVTTVRFPESDYERIRAQAAKENVKMSEFIRQAVMSHLIGDEEKDRLRELVNKAGEVSSQIRSILIPKEGVIDEDEPQSDD